MTSISGLQSALPPQLLWLNDAPLFIDDARLGAFYDAVVRPPHREGATILNITEAETKGVKGTFAAEASIALSNWLKVIFDGGAKVSASVEGSKEKSKGSNYTITLDPITTPQRQLVQLAAFYLVNFPDRLFLIDDPNEAAWRDASTIVRAPRAFVFLDVPAGTMFIPTAAEGANGAVATFYDKFVADDGARPPIYPIRKKDPAAFAQAKRDCWKWYADNFNPQKGIELIEEAARSNGKMAWVDYRMPILSGNETIHLHIAGNGKYETGTYAYYLIRRAYECGLRIIGTVKSEPAMNVLAVYER